MRKSIPYGRQSISEDDIDAVIEVLRSDRLTQGPVIEKFEKKIASKCGSKFALSANSATSSLHLSCKALEIADNDIVWTTPITYVATANSAKFCNAEIDFVDIDEETFCMSSELLQEKLERVKKLNKKIPKAIIPVHLAGHSCDMFNIKKLSDDYGFKIIEDASHAIGGRYLDSKVGEGKYSNISVFSFHPVKIITTGEGGMSLTNEEHLYQKMKRLRSHGVTRNISEMTRKPLGSWYYEQIELGFNYRMTDLQASLGLSQLKRLESFIKRRNELALRYKKHLKKLPVRFQKIAKGVISSFHLFIIRVDQKVHKSLFDFLLQNGIEANLHYYPVHLQPFYRNLGFKKGDFKNSELYGKEAISLPLFPDMTSEEQDRVIETVEKFFS